MLIISLRHDGGLTLESNDQDAENARVEDAFAGTSDEYADDYFEDYADDEFGEFEDEPYPNVSYEVLQLWRETRMEDGKLVVAFKPEHSKEIINALQDGGFYVADSILDQIFPKKVGVPKPVR